MIKQKALRVYVQNLTKRCERKFGIEYVNDNEELIECTARNKRLLDRFDEELDNSNLIIYGTGSNGQKKDDINPIIKHRNDVAKLYADNLEALHLTSRSRYKKKDNNQSKDSDPIMEYFGTINE